MSVLGTIQENIDKTLTNEYITLPVATNIKYVNYICRLCASVIDIDSAISIFPTDGFQENLALKINKYLPITVSLDGQQEFQKYDALFFFFFFGLLKFSIPKKCLQIMCF